MVSVSGVQSKLVSKVFNKLGSEITVENYSSATKDKWGDGAPSYSAGDTVKAVPYNYVKEALKWESFGDFQQGDVAIVVPHTTTVTLKDRITYDSQTWYVRELEEFVMGDGTTNSKVAIGLLLARSP